VTIASDRKAIRSLRVGVVPSSHVLDLTVGASSLCTELDQEIDAFRSGQQRSYVVSGEWGSGKSNLLSYIKEYCLRNNIAVAYINLNGRSSAINHPQRFYHRIMADVRLPGLEGRGVINLLGTINRSSKEGVLAKWAAANAHRSEMARALTAFLDGNRQWALQVILGADLTWADYPYLKEKAISRIEDFGECLRSLGYDGFMVQYDELETVVQLWNIVSRQSAYRILHRLSGLKNVWSGFATTERLNQQLTHDKRSSKLKDVEAYKFISKYFTFPTLNPPVIDGQLGKELLWKVEGLYRRVYPMPQDAQLQHVMERWMRTPFRNPRRLIRQAIYHLDIQRAVPRLIHRPLEERNAYGASQTDTGITR
jgi:hypothetical protein